MTADSGEIWCAWRSTSTPSIPGILMSVTMTSNSALSILRLAASPPVTVSTLWPSRRSVMSSSSQIERSSSQTRMLPTRASSCSRGCQRRSESLHSGGFGLDGSTGRSAGCRSPSFILDAPQTEHEAGALAHFRTRPHLALVRLDDLVDDGQTETSSAFKIRLEGLKYLFCLLRVDARTGVGETHLPIRAALRQGDGQGSTFVRRLRFHCAHRVFAEVPEHLFQFVAIGQHPGLGFDEIARQFDARVLGGEPVFEQSERVLEQRNEIHAFETILLAPGVRKKIGDDVIETIGLATNNLQEMPFIGSQSGCVRQHADRTSNRGQRIADLVGDGSAQTAHRGQPVLHAHFPLQAADFGEIVERIDETQITTRVHVEGGNAHPESLAKPVDGGVADLGIAPVSAEVGEWILEQLGH